MYVCVCNVYIFIDVCVYEKHVLFLGERILKNVGLVRKALNFSLLQFNCNLQLDLDNLRGKSNN